MASRRGYTDTMKNAHIILAILLATAAAGVLSACAGLEGGHPVLRMAELPSTGG